MRALPAAIWLFHFLGMGETLPEPVGEADWRPVSRAMLGKRLRVRRDADYHLHLSISKDIRVCFSWGPRAIRQVSQRGAFVHRTSCFVLKAEACLVRGLLLQLQASFLFAKYCATRQHPCAKQPIPFPPPCRQI
jgi:hypothetical protein